MSESLQFKADTLRVLENTLSSTRKTQVEADVTARDFAKFLTDFEKFVEEVQRGAESQQQETKASFYEQSILGMLSWTRSEAERLRVRPLILQEREKTLVSVIDHLNSSLLVSSPVDSEAQEG